jgi:hypothetical protein
VSDSIRDEGSLSAELSALRSALREVRAPDDELALRSAASARRADVPGPVPRPTAPRQTIVAAARARAMRARRSLAVAVAAAIVIAAVAVAVRVEHVQRAERADGAERAAAAPRATEPVMAAPKAAPEPPSVRPAFRPISFSRRLSTAETYSVVRVRLELATSAPGAGAAGAAIEADLLVGEDGLARAIRFDSADTLPVYAASSAASGERR